jgi:hypothetical protein
MVLGSGFGRSINGTNLSRAGQCGGALHKSGKHPVKDLFVVARVHKCVDETDKQDSKERNDRQGGAIELTVPQASLRNFHDFSILPNTENSSPVPHRRVISFSLPLHITGKTLVYVG